MTDPDLILLAGRAVANADALRNGRHERIPVMKDCLRLATDLLRHQAPRRYQGGLYWAIHDLIGATFEEARACQPPRDLNALIEWVRREQIAANREREAAHEAVA